MKILKDGFPGIPAFDFLMSLVVVLTALLMLSILDTKVDAAAKQAHVSSNALYLITVDWSGESDDDVDTYVQDPADHLVYFRRLQDGLMCLTRDDTGRHSNTINLPDGRVVQSATNEERVEVRGIIEGEYVVNLHMYRKDKNDPCKTIVTLYKVSAAEDVKLHEKVVTLTTSGQEETAFRFTLTKTGEVGDINELPKRFVGSAAASEGQP